MRYETVRYEAVKRQASKSLPCPGCGKKVRRSRTFEMTISPFNKNADGQPRTRTEIWEALGEKAAEWQQKAEQCTPCREGGAR